MINYRTPATANIFVGSVCDDRTLVNNVVLRGTMPASTLA